MSLMGIKKVGEGRDLNYEAAILLKMAAAVLEDNCPLVTPNMSHTTLLSTQPSSLDTTK